MVGECAFFDLYIAAFVACGKLDEDDGRFIGADEGDAIDVFEVVVDFDACFFFDFAFEQVFDRVLKV